MTSSPGSMVSTSGPAPAACRRSTASGRPSLVVTSPDSSRLGRLADRRQPDVLRQRQPGIAVDADGVPRIRPALDARQRDEQPGEIDHDFARPEPVGNGLAFARAGRPADAQAVVRVRERSL